MKKCHPRIHILDCVLVCVYYKRRGGMQSFHETLDIYGGQLLLSSDESLA